MPITPAQITAAEAIQHAAAHDPAHQVRLIAGPGTGKSATIVERVNWLLGQGIPADQIYVVSFTRASARDLQQRITNYCNTHGQPAVSQVSVTTLHSLALRALRQAGLLAYPVNPLVMDNWELKNIHDPEYSYSTGFRPGRAGSGTSLQRAKEIREDYEAYCGTGMWNPPTYLPPQPPLIPQERQGYQVFHMARTQLYSYVLPGEIVKQCVENINAGVLDPAVLLNITHLVVDEYQDLNPVDLDFVDSLIFNGVTTFVAGDDDQSLYSFRHASPVGIQSFDQRHPASAYHELRDCFRSTRNVLAPAINLISHFQDQNRIPKHLSSLYDSADPVEHGIAFRWRFPQGATEVRAIADSCRTLIAADIPPREIMILISDTRALLPSIKQALTRAGVAFESPRGESFLDTPVGRFAFSIARIICEPNDYIAHRLILGLLPGVGIAACNSIAQKTISNMLNYRDLFYRPIPQGVFSQRELNALDSARNICALISQWSEDDTLAARLPAIHNILLSLFGQQDADRFQAEIEHIPQDATLVELRDYLWADNDEQRANILSSLYERLGLIPPPQGFLPPQVRVMTMHGAKGLDATVVFILGIEDQMLPGPRRRPYPGLVLEAARMLYVSITRARAACILSYAENRVMHGNYGRTTPSPFIRHVAGPFIRRSGGLNPGEVAQIVQSALNL